MKHFLDEHPLALFLVACAIMIEASLIFALFIRLEETGDYHVCVPQVQEEVHRDVLDSRP